MKTKLTHGILLVSATFFLLSFVNHEPEQGQQTEEYGFIITYNNVLEKTANGKTEIIRMEGEKIEGATGKYFNIAVVAELNKMNKDGYELVNVTSSLGSVVRDMYMFKRKR